MKAGEVCGDVAIVGPALVGIWVGTGVEPAIVRAGLGVSLPCTRNWAMSRRGAGFGASSPVIRRRSVRSVSFEISFSVSKTP